MIPASHCLALLNGDFEAAEPNELLDFNAPADWTRQNYAAILTNFVPEPERGHARFWRIDTEAGLDPYQGESFVVLSTGDVVPDPFFASISQQVEVQPGSRISGLYFFGTCDYVPYPDQASITLVPVSPPEMNEIVLMDVNIADVGNYSSMNGWAPFVHVFDVNEAGIYDLVIRVDDEGDNIFKSYLAVDGIKICDTPPLGDVNYDCCVDFDDFAVIASDWCRDCSDPFYFADPNANCRFGTDLDASGPIDANDVSIFADRWLDSPP